MHFPACTSLLCCGTNQVVGHGTYSIFSQVSSCRLNCLFSLLFVSISSVILDPVIHFWYVLTQGHRVSKPIYILQRKIIAGCRKHTQMIISSERNCRVGSRVNLLYLTWVWPFHMWTSHTLCHLLNSNHFWMLEKVKKTGCMEGV